MTPLIKKKEERCGVAGMRLKGGGGNFRKVYTRCGELDAYCTYVAAKKKKKM